MTGERIPDPRDADAEEAYDIIIAKELGWDQAALLRTEPEMRAGVAWLLFAEKAWPAGLVEWLDQPELTTEREVKTHKVRARGQVERVRRVLFPYDEGEPQDE